MVTWPLIGRENERAQILQSLNDEGAVVIAGPAGVGKSRLLLDVTDQLTDQGISVLRLAGAESVGASPWSALLDEQGPAPDIATSAVNYLSRRSRSGRLVLAIDDAQLFDPASAAALYRVARTRSADLLIALRTGEPADDAIVALWKDDLAVNLRLDPLAEPAVGTLLASVLGPLGPEQTRWFFERSKGHPLFLRELVTGLQDAGALDIVDGRVELDMAAPVPSRLIELIRRHIERQGDEAVRVLALFDLCQSLNRRILDFLGIAGPIQRLVRRDLVSRTGDELTLGHPLYGEAATDALPFDELNELRVAAANALLRERGRTVQAALLLLDAGKVPDQRVTVDAISSALRRFQPELVVRLGDHLDDRERGDELWASVADVAVAHAMLGDLEQRDLLFDRALLHAPEQAVSELWLRRLATAFDYQDDPGEIEELARRATPNVSGGDAQVLQARLLRPRMFVEPLAPIFDQLSDLISSPDLDERASAAVFLDAATTGWHLLRLDRARTYIEAAIAATTGDPVNNARAEQVLVVISMWINGFSQASAAAGQRIIEARRIGFADAIQLALGSQAIINSRSGNAAAVVDNVHAMAASSGDATHRRHQPLILAEYSLALSALPSRSEDFERCLARINELPAGARINAEVLVEVAQARVARRAGQPDDASAHLDLALKRARWRNSRAHEVVVLRERAYTAGPTPEDVAAIESIAAVAGAGLAELFRDEIRAMDSADGAALDAVSRRAEAYGSPVIAAEAASAAKVFHLDADNYGEAFSAERRANALLAEFDGWEPPLTWRSDPVLSSREQEVVDLVCLGHTNAAVADQLYISSHTVKRHLERIYDKLDVRSRRGLAALGSADPSVPAL